MIVELTKLKHGESGTVVELQGGAHFSARMHSMGIREGKKITKISSHFWRGPQTVRIGHAQFAVGFGMARKVMVEVKRSG